MKARAGNKWAVLAGIGIGLALLAAVVLRFTTTSDLWLDEALSVNVAKLPLGDLHEALKRDGAPPLYYVLLHFWIDAFGTSDEAVRALSGLISLATLPALYYAGRRLGGRAAAWTAVLLLATLPFAIRYATEARMYALVMFIVAWGYLAFVRAFERPSMGRLALVALVVAALLYTHNWSWYLWATVGALVVLRAWQGSTAHERHAARRVLVAMVVGGLAYLPWVPTLAYQLKHTGTPWGDARLPWSGFVAALGSFAGIAKPVHGEAYLMAGVLIVLPLLGVFGRGIDARRIEVDLRTVPTVRWEAAVAYGSVVVGLTLSYVAGTAFDGRYASVAVPLMVLVMAMGVMTFTGPVVRGVVLTVVVLLGLVGGVRNADDNRTQASQVVQVIQHEAEPGDVVLYCPDQLGPSVHRLLGDGSGLREMTFPDLARPEIVNWVDYRDRIGAASPDDVAQRVLARADGQTIWYVVSPGYRGVEGKCEVLGAAIAAERPEAAAAVSPDDDTYFEFMGLTRFSP